MKASDAGNRLNKVYEASGGNGSFYPGNTTRITALVAKSETFRSFVMHPLMLSACDAILKPNCASYQVHATAGLVVGPGATVQVLHREEDGFQFFKAAAPEHGARKHVGYQRFHRGEWRHASGARESQWAEGRVARDDEVVAAEMPAGSVLLWMGGTLHGAGANRTTVSGATGFFFPTRSDGCGRRKINTSTRRRQCRAHVSETAAAPGRLRHARIARLYRRSAQRLRGEHNRWPRDAASRRPI